MGTQLKLAQCAQAPGECSAIQMKLAQVLKPRMNALAMKKG